jgi:hypothetical protein
MSLPALMSVATAKRFSSVCEGLDAAMALLREPLTVARCKRHAARSHPTGSKGLK